MGSYILPPIFLMVMVMVMLKCCKRKTLFLLEKKNTCVAYIGPHLQDPCMIWSLQNKIKQLEMCSLI